MLETGIAAEKVHRIPIGIDPVAFPLADGRRQGARPPGLGLPESAFVVGSFQKDGVGWGEGLEPKLIKGPDVLVAAARAAREHVPDLWFCSRARPVATSRRGSSAPASRTGTGYLPSLESVARAYEAIDLCIVASRDEGGPRAVLESMAIGVPLVTTRVGQAADLVRTRRTDGSSRSRTSTGSSVGIATCAEAPRGAIDESSRPAGAPPRRTPTVRYAPRWRSLLEGLVDLPEAGALSGLRPRRPLRARRRPLGATARDAAAAPRGPRLLRSRPRAGAGRARRGRHGEDAEAQRALP